MVSGHDLLHLADETTVVEGSGKKLLERPVGVLGQFFEPFRVGIGRADPIAESFEVENSRWVETQQTDLFDLQHPEHTTGFRVPKRRRKDPLARE